MLGQGGGDVGSSETLQGLVGHMNEFCPDLKKNGEPNRLFWREGLRESHWSLETMTLVTVRKMD